MVLPVPRLGLLICLWLVYLVSRLVSGWEPTTPLCFSVRSIWARELKTHALTFGFTLLFQQKLTQQCEQLY